MSDMKEAIHAEYAPWSCDYCTAACTFEAMNWCGKRSNPKSKCGYDEDQPHAWGTGGSGPFPAGHPEGIFEFVQLKVRFEGKMYGSVAEHATALAEEREP